MPATPRRTSLHRAVALALALASPGAAAQALGGAVFFGDSLTDSGTLGARFTTNPDPVWAERFAARLGAQAQPAPGGGANFAVGGARVSGLPGVPNSPPTDTATPIADQISAHLAATGGVASRGALYSVWGGANDVFVALGLGAGASAYLALTADELAAQIARLHAAGARYLLVPNLPDIGATPFGASLGPAGAAGASALTAGYNAALYAGVAARGLAVIPLDVRTLFNEVLANPALYGFANTTLPACGATPSLACTPADLVAPDANRTFLFADGVHPTGAGHAVIADYAASIVAAPAQISLLAETALQARRTQADRLLQRPWQPPTGRALWLNVEGERHGADAGGIAGSAKGSGAGVTLGADLIRREGLVLGAALGFASVKPDFDLGGGYRQDETAFSLYAGWQAAGWQASAALTYGSLDYELSREVRLGPAVRTASASPRGRNLSAGAELGYRFAHGALAHGPLAGLLLQRAEIDAFAESGAGAAGLRYDEQKRSSALGRLGWQLAYDAGRWQPYARLTLERELRDDEREVRAQLLTLPGLAPFSLPAAQPDRTFGVLAAGANVRLAEGWSAGIAVSRTLAQSQASSTLVAATAARAF